MSFRLWLSPGRPDGGSSGAGLPQPRLGAAWSRAGRAGAAARAGEGRPGSWVRTGSGSQEEFLQDPSGLGRRGTGKAEI